MDEQRKYAIFFQVPIFGAEGGTSVSRERHRESLKSESPERAIADLHLQSTVGH